MRWILIALLMARTAAAQNAPPTTAVVLDSTAVDEAARLAWKHFDRLWRSSTGLAAATPGYDKLTSWDIGSVLGALFSARQLGLIGAAEYEKRLNRTLKTLETLPLFQNTAYHKMYGARTAKMVSRGGGPSTKGYGWSATDLGRLLVWLRIIADNEPARRGSIERIVQRMNYGRILGGGYMFGEEIMRNGQARRFQEGRIGYEQYAAQGFALWNKPVDKAMDLRLNARPVDVLGVQLMADQRGLDRIVSEPFVLMGLELGWSADVAQLARNVLAAQEARYKQTGDITIASEDAISIAPYYFYYYCIYCNGKPFVIDVADPGKSLDKPRWISTKSTIGWFVLLPNDYTRLAWQTVQKAKTSVGWSSGVFEKTFVPTRTYDLNTAAVVLEAAAYYKLGRPLLKAGSPSARPE